MKVNLMSSRAARPAARAAPGGTGGITRPARPGALPGSRGPGTTTGRGPRGSWRQLPGAVDDL